MTTNQDTRGFLPPTITTTTNDLRHQSPSSTTTGNHPHQPSGFTVLPLPPKTPPTTEEETQVLAAALAHAIIQFRDAVTTTIGNTHLNRTKSDVNSSVNQEHATTTVKRTPIHRANNTNSTGHQEQRKTTTTPPFPGTETGCLDRDESPQLKRLRKMEDTVTEIKERCWESISRCESGVTEEHDHDADDAIADDNHHPSQAMVEQDGVREERVQFKQHEDGGVSIRLSCSCGKSYEMLHTQTGCFYRLI